MASDWPIHLHTCVFLPCRDTKGWRWVVASPEAGAIEPPNYRQRRKTREIGLKLLTRCWSWKTWLDMINIAKYWSSPFMFYEETSTPTISPGLVQETPGMNSCNSSNLTLLSIACPKTPKMAPGMVKVPASWKGLPIGQELGHLRISQGIFGS